MGSRLKLFGFALFLLLSLSFCRAKSATVNIVGSIHCTDCIRRDFSNSQASLGVDVVISCKSKNTETKTQGNSAINREGKFNVTLSAEIKEDIDGCFAKLQTASSAAPCPIQTAQTATVELLSTDGNATEAVHNKPTVIKFSPLTCQSAFFWPMPNLTFFPSAPPPLEPPVEYATPPSEVLAPVQPPSSPEGDLTPPPAPASEPSYIPQVPSLPPTLSAPAPDVATPPPSPPQESGTPQTSPAPASAPPFPVHNTPPPQLSPQAPPLLPIPPPNPKFQKPTPPPLPPFTKPILPPIPKFHKPSPILPPIPPKKHKTPQIMAPIAPPIAAPSPPRPLPETPNSPAPLPKHEKAPSPTEISTPPSGKKPSTIPRAPPVPRLPPTPQVPRKYFNAPKSKSKPPRSI